MEDRGALLHDAESQSAQLQGGIERLRAAHGRKIAQPSAEPIFHKDTEGNTVNRAGQIVLPKVEPIPPPAKVAK